MIPSDTLVLCDDGFPNKTCTLMRHTSRVNVSHFEVAGERLVSDASNYTVTMSWEMSFDPFSCASL